MGNGFFAKIFGKSKDNQENKMEQVEQPGKMNYEQLAGKIIERLKNQTLKQSVEMLYTKKEAGLTESKLSGVPFIPIGGEYPVEAGTGKKLYLLVQINFAEMPHISDYPKEGILQIFIGADDYYGCDLDDGQNQEKWKIIYHKDLSQPMTKEEIVAMMPDMDEDADALPFENPGEEYRIGFKKVEVPISYSDINLTNRIQELCDDILPDDLKECDWVDYPDEMTRLLEDALNGSGSRVGGYPIFTQSDPRDCQMLQNYELLLQIDSDEDSDGENVIMWGDFGVVNFFIDPADLKRGDFSRVYYNWDCG